MNTVGIYLFCKLNIVVYYKRHIVFGTYRLYPKRYIFEMIIIGILLAKLEYSHSVYYCLSHLFNEFLIAVAPRSVADSIQEHLAWSYVHIINPFQNKKTHTEYHRMRIINPYVGITQIKLSVGNLISLSACTTSSRSLFLVVEYIVQQNILVVNVKIWFLNQIYSVIIISLF